MTRHALLLLLLFVGSPAWAQTPRGAQHLSATQLRDTVAGAARAQTGMAGALLADRGSYTVLVLRRDQTGEVEIHDAWDDVFVVQEGMGTLLLGGTVTGDRVTAPGERRGGRISGGGSQTLVAGDVMVIPAKTPHQVQVPAGGSITYLVIKTPSAGTSPPRP
jgi:mannose-6-phosphate isomerase-like protein (cupin superfamily)